MKDTKVAIDSLNMAVDEIFLTHQYTGDRQLITIALLNHLKKMFSPGELRYCLRQAELTESSMSDEDRAHAKGMFDVGREAGREM